MRILVLNAGSSSLKYKLFETDESKVLFSGVIQQIGESSSKYANHHDAMESLNMDFSTIDAVGHRVVHGGEKFSSAIVIDKNVESEIEALIPLAPLHNRANLEGIKVVKLQSTTIPQVAVFDTAFHSTMTKEAYLYAIPLEMYAKHNIRRYGFHGTSHSFVLKSTAKTLKKEVNTLNLITLHLGNGASVCAIKNGKSIDTSMGFTPLEGLVMGSRSGDIDPAIVLYMQRELGLNVDEVDSILNKKSGLVGICGENDVRMILESENKNSKLALSMMIRRIQKYIGAYMALLGSVDAVVFTGGIGENSSYVRDEVMSSELFKDTRVLVVRTDEELEIALEVEAIMKKKVDNE